MELTAKNLMDMIEEELNRYLNESNMCHDPKTGFWDSCDTNAIYSLSHRAAEKNKIDKKYVGRGTLTKNRKIQAPFGMNTAKDISAQCGRQTIDGKPKPKTKRCRDYPKGQYDEDHHLVPNDDDAPSERSDKIFPGYSHLRQLANGIYEDETNGSRLIDIDVLINLIKDMVATEESHLIDENNNAMITKCRELGFRTSQEHFQNLVRTINTLELSLKGDLMKGKA